MNKYSIKDFLHAKLERHKSTLQKTSFDDAKNIYLCSDKSMAHVYNFDSYIEENFDMTQLPASPDAILVGEKKIYFIEFKNQSPSDINKKNIKDKFDRGTKILKDLLKDFKPQDIEYIFCVVHKNQPSRYFNSAHIESMIPKFGLEEKNADFDSFYAKIIVEDIDYYKRNFKQLQC